MFYALCYILNTDTHCMTKTQDNSETMKHNNDGKCAVCHLYKSCVKYLGCQKDKFYLLNGQL